MAKYINQINNTLIKLIEVWSCFWERFFKNIWLDCEQHEKNQYKKKEHKHHSLMFERLRQLPYYLSVTDPLIIPEIFIFLSCR